jgi:hypothetical protein
MFWFWFLLSLVTAVAFGFIAIVAAADPEGRGTVLALIMFACSLAAVVGNIVFVANHLWSRFKGWA